MANSTMHASCMNDQTSAACALFHLGDLRGATCTIQHPSNPHEPRCRSRRPRQRLQHPACRPLSLRTRHRFTERRRRASALSMYESADVLGFQALREDERLRTLVGPNPGLQALGVSLEAPRYQPAARVEPRPLPRQCHAALLGMEQRDARSVLRALHGLPCRAARRLHGDELQ